jgi:hypothetical protein
VEWSPHVALQKRELRFVCPQVPFQFHRQLITFLYTVSRTYRGKTASKLFNHSFNRLFRARCDPRVKHAFPSYVLGTCFLRTKWTHVKCNLCTLAAMLGSAVPTTHEPNSISVHAMLRASWLIKWGIVPCFLKCGSL